MHAPIPVRVFLSSPSHADRSEDVGPERAVVRRVINRLRVLYKDRLSIELYMWEHQPLLGTDRFQPQIENPEETFDLFILVLWSRLGSPPGIPRPDGTQYQSGTQYEVELALESHKQLGKPELLLYRKTARLRVELAPGDLTATTLQAEIDRTDAYWQSLVGDPPNRAHFIFDSIDKFENVLLEHLPKVLERIESTKRKAAGHGGSTVTATVPSESPFLGLRCFDIRDADWFCGRTAEVVEAFTAIQDSARRRLDDAPRKEEKTGRGYQGASTEAVGTLTDGKRPADGEVKLSSLPFLLVIGRSGLGKSSFVRAGVAPCLMDEIGSPERADWIPVVFEPSDSTVSFVEGFVAAILEACHLDAALEQEGTIPEYTIDRTTLERVSGRLRARPANAASIVRDEFPSVMREGRRLLVIVDPLEELFTCSPGRRDSPTESASLEADRGDFVRVLTGLLEGEAAWALATLRSDFHDQALGIKVLDSLCARGCLHRLSAPGPSALKKMISTPASIAGLVFGPAPGPGDRTLDDVLVDESSRCPDSLPLLGFVLDELYRAAKDEGATELLYSAYESLGGFTGAIARRAEVAFGAVVNAHSLQSANESLRTLCSHIVGFGDIDRGQLVRRYGLRDDLQKTPVLKTLVDTFVRERILFTDRDDRGRPVISFAHESILTKWPPLTKEIESNKDYLRAVQYFKIGADEWDKDRTAALAQGKNLDKAKSLVDHHRDDLPDTILSYLEESMRVGFAEQRLYARMKFAGVTSIVLLACLLAFSRFRVSQYADAMVQKSHALEGQLVKTELERVRAVDQAGQALSAEIHAAKRRRAFADLAMHLFDSMPRDLETGPDGQEVVDGFVDRLLSYHRAIEAEPNPSIGAGDHARSLVYAAGYLHAIGRHAEAIELLASPSRWIGVNGAADAALECRFLDVRGRARAALGMHGEAHDDFVRMAEIAPDESWRRRAVLQQGRVEGFVGDADNAGRLLASADAPIDLADLLREYGELEEAMVLLGIERASQGEALTGTDAPHLYTESWLSPNAEDRGRRLASVSGSLLADRARRAPPSGGPGSEDAIAAIAILEDVLAGDVVVRGQGHPVTIGTGLRLVAALIDEGRLDNAEAMLAKSTAMLDVFTSAPQALEAELREVEAELKAARGRYARAVESLQRCIELRRPLVAAGHPSLRRPQARLSHLIDTMDAEGR